MRTIETVNKEHECWKSISQNQLASGQKMNKKRGIEKPFFAKEKPCRVKEKLWATGQEIDGTQNL